MSRLAVICAMLLAGCASPRQQAVTTPVVVREAQIVERPVPVPCVTASQLPQPPALLTEAELRALPDFEAVIALEQQRRALIQYHDRASAVLAGCTKQE